MCGRTACTLAPDTLVVKCSYKPGVGAKTNNNTTKESHDTGSGSDCTVVPVWTEAPCGGKYSPSTNIPPTSYTPILYNNMDNQLLLQPMLWGVVPPWHPGPDPKSHGLSTNNCRLENVMTSKLYKPCLSRGRCVVVCQGFYEWERSGGVKQPYLVYRAGGVERGGLGGVGSEEGGLVAGSGEKGGGIDLGLLYMAGLYSVWKDGDGTPVYNYTIITRESNKVLSWLHHRMPAFLEPSQFGAWLNAGTSPSQALDLLSLPAEGDLAWHPVSREVGNVRNQQLDLMERVEPEVEQLKKKTEKTVSEASKGIMSNWLKRSRPNKEETEKKMKIGE